MAHLGLGCLSTPPLPNELVHFAANFYQTNQFIRRNSWNPHETSQVIRRKSWNPHETSQAIHRRSRNLWETSTIFRERHLHRRSNLMWTSRWSFQMDTTTIHSKPRMKPKHFARTNNSFATRKTGSVTKIPASQMAYTGREKQSRIWELKLDSCKILLDYHEKST